MSKVAIVGLGYVGLPLAVRSAEVGHEVIGVDTDLRRIESLRAHLSYVADVADDRIQTVTAGGHFRATTGFDGLGVDLTSSNVFDVGIIAVPTPLRGTTPDLSFVESAAQTLGKVLRPGGTVVLESTTYPGTTENLLAGILEETSGLVVGRDFHLGFSPERIDPGNRVHTLENTPKLVSATTVQGLGCVRAFYDTIVETTVPVSRPRVAELAKLFENIQANVNIALINEVATICHDLDVDVWEMLDASMTKGHSVAYWTPGPGVGGHCLPVDPLYLAWQVRQTTGRRFLFADLADQVNKGRPRYVAQRVETLLAQVGSGIAGSNILVLGVAYKPNVADVRESPAIDVVNALAKRGAGVSVVDPYVTDWSLTPIVPFKDLSSRIGEFDVVVVVTNHRDFDYDQIGKLATLVLDCRNAIPPGPNVVRL